LSQTPSHPYWPLLDLRLRSGDLVLAPLTEADLDELVARLPDDVELDPSATVFEGADLGTRRGTVVYQGYWRGFGTWSPEAWRLDFVVRRGSELLGRQELEGNDFPKLRTVDSSSWLVETLRGQGIGKRMRRAVLALAFGPLGAREAITSAWHDNMASLGVSRAIGYTDNGVSTAMRGDRLDTMVHLRMTAADWEATGAGDDVLIEGFEPCRPFFGLDRRHAPVPGAYPFGGR
jgi:RimJ/RimL family protein N-acetyltransferase